MIVFPNCKINLGLHILQKRSDGFHDLETIFYPIPIQDALEIIPIDTKESELVFTASGLPVDGTLESNICYKAYHLLKRQFPQLPSIKMHLHKRIPMGAGLGGGSADGAYTLLALNKKFNLGLSESALIDLSLQLGSDAPFFIANKPAYATARGEQLAFIDLDLSMYRVFIVNPKIHINTAWAFNQITPNGNRPSLKQLIQSPLSEWKDWLMNDFEAPIFQAYPEIASIKKAFYRSGALYAAMTGSGSTVYGIFPKDAELTNLPFPDHYFVKEV